MNAPVPDLLSALDRAVLRLDGGVGSELIARAGAPGPCERWNVERPELVRAVHADYLATGCDAITTNSFCADAPTLARTALAGRAEELGRAAARLAREAADAVAADGRRPWVLGSLGPGWDLPTLRGGDDAALEAGYAELARALAEGGVDALLVETVRDARQARAALRAARDAAPSLPRLVSFAPFVGGALAGGVTLASAVTLLAELEPALWGVNCLSGAAGCERALDELRAAGARRLGAWPNAGLPDSSRGRPVWPLEPEPFARALAALAARFDLRLIGGCCGTTPAHVAALATVLARGAART